VLLNKPNFLYSTFQNSWEGATLNQKEATDLFLNAKLTQHSHNINIYGGIQLTF
jgi:hypothetical protein